MSDLPLSVWPELKAHAKELQGSQLTELFANDAGRARRFFIDAAGIKLDYSKNFFNARTQDLLKACAAELELPDLIQQMFQGAMVNNTEQRAALHTLLRANEAPNEHLQGSFAEVRDTLSRIREMTNRLRDGSWSGATGKPIRNVVHIGIGGSFLGPNMVDEALCSRRNVATDIQCHYIANVDGHHIQQVLATLDPSETLVIVVSKTFTTLETKANADTAKAWLEAALPEITPHLLAVSANTEAAAAYGVAAANILPMWDWVGGRYSLWSAVGVPIAIRYGFEAFRELLEGAAAMDQHFQSAPPEQNIPVVLGFLGVLYQHCFHSSSHAVLTYDHRLRLLPDHLQQVDMESNGKSVSAAGQPIKHDTGAIIWGGEGTNGQHAFHQLLHQGTRFTGIDFILTLRPDHDMQSHHDKLIASGLSQAQALMIGRSIAELELESSDLKRAHKVMPGNRPSNTILLDQVTPASIGALIAMYEHKVFVQAMFWAINPFDQWGVELGKELGSQILSAMAGSSVSLDPSTENLLRLYQATRTNS
jgi:glucose-6-phosphate isomerase